MRILLVIIAICFCVVLSAQPFVSYTLDRDTIEPGDRVTMELKLTSHNPIGEITVAYSPLDTIENVAMQDDTTRLNEGKVDIEWIDAPFSRPREKVSASVARDSSGSYTLYQEFLFTIWDIGAFNFPYPYFIDKQGDTLEVRALQPPLLFSLISENIAPQDTTLMIHDIHTIVPESKNWKDYLWLIIAITLAIAAALIYFAIKRRESKVIEEAINIEPKVIIPAHITAYQKLKQLRSERPWEQGKVKEYQTQLTYIIREYLENRFEVQALESTTGEIVTDLAKKDFNTKHSTSLTRILQVADLVKFAKAEPTNDMHESFLNEAEQFVDETKLEEENIDDAE